nr:NusG domain II-containing protein [uncultured Romboutsia sp.]
MKIFKKMDFVIIVVLITFSFIPNLIYSNIVSKSNKNLYTTIKINSKVYTTIDLPVASEKRLPISTTHGNNTIVVNGNEIKILDADCKDELCIRQGSISKVGKTLICLPNELIIEIKGDEYDSSDDLILSH